MTGSVWARRVAVWLLAALPLAAASPAPARCAEPGWGTVQTEPRPGEARSWLAAMPAPTSTDASSPSAPDLLDHLDLHGFLETRVGSRLQRNPKQKRASIRETRLQGEAALNGDEAQLKLKGDVWHDGVTERMEGDLREAWASFRVSDALDVKAGRQVLSWGTGDMVFLNDLFPKDWVAFYTGRDTEYLKAPMDGIKVSAYGGAGNLDLVYAPLFAPDRFVTGERLTYWNDAAGSLCGQGERMATHTPDRAFSDGEAAARLHGTWGAAELALYGYWGFWKTPSGQDGFGRQVFPRLNVYGGSLRAPLGPGIVNVEGAWYQSAQDQGGRNPAIANSEARYLAGYAMELARDLNASAQYYVEQMLAYGRYRETLATGRPRDRFRHVLTLQVTRLLLGQDLDLTLQACWSPSDHDAYLRPRARYRVNDRLSVEAGANLFFGHADWTSFGQHKKDSNLYTGLRYSF